jgi:cephalosporin hydroxylase
MSYRNKLQHNYHELAYYERLRYWLLDRRRVPPDVRFFFEGVRQLPGQMYIADRKALSGTVIKYMPQICYEIGTWIGGGSTFFLASAFAKLGRGKVVTTEVDVHAYQMARSTYETVLPHLLPFVEFHNTAKLDVFMPFIRQNQNTVDCVFLDGADDARQTMEQYEFFRPYFKTGTILMVHDWNTEKMRGIRPVIEGNPKWNLELNISSPDSIGFATYIYT